MTSWFMSREDALVGIAMHVREVTAVEEKEMQMKITEDSINHNVTLLIDDYTEVIWEIDEDNQDHKRLMTLGYIRGVIEMGKAMKEVLKS